MLRYVLHCVGEKCLKPTMRFCQFATTNNIRTLTQVAADLNTHEALKLSIINELKECELPLTKSVLQIRQNLFGFESIEKFKNCQETNRE